MEIFSTLVWVVLNKMERSLPKGTSQLNGMVPGLVRRRLLAMAGVPRCLSPGRRLVCPRDLKKDVSQ